MKNAIRAEWIKLRTVRSTLVLLFVSVGLSLLLSILPAIFIGRDESDVMDPGFLDMLIGAALAMNLFGVVAALVATSDFRFTIRATLAAQPLRAKVVAAKAIVVAAATLVATAVMIAMSLGSGAIVLSMRDMHLGVGEDGWENLAGLLTYAVLFSLAGLAVGLIIRHSAGAIVTLLLWPLMGESILGALASRYFSWLVRWLPFGAGSRLFAFTDDTELFGRWAGGLYFAAWVAALLAFGTFLLRRRDA